MYSKHMSRTESWYTGLYVTLSLCNLPVCLKSILIAFRVPYDSSTADYHFTTPVLYWFTVSIITKTRTNVALAVNGDKLVVADDGDSFAGDAVSAMLMLEVGDKVSVLKYRSSDDLFEELDRPGHNTFAGFLYAQL